LIIGEKFMSMKPLAEAYERLKERRRRGGLASDAQSKAEVTAAERGVEILSWVEIKLPRDVLNVFDDEASRARIIDILFSRIGSLAIKIRPRLG
jgi:hypothetical protein